MNDKGHFYVSLLKSALRIIGCVHYLATFSVVPFVSLFLAAEVLGIVEEIFDRRK
jgi:hypothetical protein